MERRSLLILVAIAGVALAVAFVLAAGRDDGTSAAVTTTVAPSPTGTTGPPTTEPADTTPAPETTQPVEETTVAPVDTTAPIGALPPGTTACDPYTTITKTGTVASTGLVEASGLGASRTRPGVLWSHNDSRDGARIYAIGEDGADLGSFDIAGTLAFDWEDMAAGPGSDPGTSMLYLGDIGDNFSIRDGRITVHRVPEPDPTTPTDPIEGAVALEYRYPDGVYNAEALFVWDGAIYIITKDKEEARVYRGDATGDGSDVETLELVTVLPLGAEVSGADISWDGSTIAFRGYRTVWMWHHTSDRSIADTLAGEPCTAPSPDEVQGESIAFLQDGSYATVSEGEHPDVFIVGRDG